MGTTNSLPSSLFICDYLIIHLQPFNVINVNLLSLMKV